VRLGWARLGWAGHGMAWHGILISNSTIEIGGTLSDIFIAAEVYKYMKSEGGGHGGGKGGS